MFISLSPIVSKTWRRRDNLADLQWISVRDRESDWILVNETELISNIRKDRSFRVVPRQFPLLI